MKKEISAKNTYFSNDELTKLHNETENKCVTEVQSSSQNFYCISYDLDFDLFCSITVNRNWVEPSPLINICNNLKWKSFKSSNSSNF